MAHVTPRLHLQQIIYGCDRHGTGSEYALPTSRPSIFYETLSAGRSAMLAAAELDGDGLDGRSGLAGESSEQDEAICLHGCVLPPAGCLPVDIRLDEYLNCLYC